MIGLGSQYLTAAGFGKYRITAASLGNLDLLRIVDWLRYATKQAILGAFGDDGKAVIKATNAYLNALAASDRDKATALADYLNSSTTIAVNWGTYLLDYQPVEYIEAQGSQRIDTGWAPNQNTGFDIDYVMKNPVSTSGFGSLIACRHGWNTTNARCYELTTYNGVPRCSESGGFGFGDGLVNAGFVKDERQQQYLRNQVYTNAKGVQTIFTENFQVSYSLAIFCLHSGSTWNEYGKAQLYAFNMYDGDTEIRHYMPVYRKSDNVIGLWDLNQGEFKTNSGSGTFLKGADINIMPTP